MIYSDWKTSVWFTIWSIESDEVFKKNQIFEICDAENIRFTFEEIKEDIVGCLQKVKLIYSLEKEIEIKSNYFVDKNGTLGFFTQYKKLKPVHLKENELNELRKYMIDFVKDVENDNSLI